MNNEQYLNYMQPDKPHVDWTDEQLFDEVDFIATHRINIGATGERDQQLKDRMRKAVGEQCLRYWIKKHDEEEISYIEQEEA